MSDDITRYLSAIWREGEVREVRIPIKDKPTSAGWFDSPQTAAAAVAQIDGRANSYITVNPVKPDLLSRAPNRIKSPIQDATADSDITRRRWLPIDIDPVRPSGTSSTEEEKAAAYELCLDVTDYLTGKGWPKPVEAMSGNGYLLLYEIDLPNDDESKRLVNGVLKHLAQLLDNEKAHVDITVGNAARIVALVGTMKVKGKDTDDRPHRRSKLLKAPNPIQTVSKDMLESLCPPTTAQEPRADQNGDRMPPGWVRELLDYAKVRYRSPRKNGDGITWFGLETCPFHDDGQDGHCAVGEAEDGRGVGKCFHNRGFGKDWHDFKAALRLTSVPPVRLNLGPTPGGSANGGFKIVKLSEVKAAPVIWMWKNWLPLGEVIVLDGLAAMSKSTIFLDWMARMTNGDPMPDRVRIAGVGDEEPDRRIEGLIITNEDKPESVIKPRFHVHGGDMDRLSVLKAEFSMPTNGPDLEGLLRDNPDIKVVLIDPLFSHVDEGINSNSDIEVRKQVMDPLAGIAERAGVVIFVARHWNKKSGDTIELRGSGSYGGITGRSRGVISVTEDPDCDLNAPNPTRLIGPSKMSYGRIPKALRFHIESVVPDLDGFGEDDDVPRVVWDGISSYDIKTAQAMSEQKKVATRTERIDSRLRSILNEGPLRATEVERRLKAEDFGDKAIDAATRRCDVVKKKVGFGRGSYVMWSLPDRENPDMGLDGED